MKNSSSSFYWGESFIGRRGNNEDNFCTAQINDDLLILAVADGMGGTVAGERASKLAIDTLLETFTDNDYIRDSIWLKNLLRSAYAEIQKRIAQEVEDDPSLAGMGTTLTVALVVEDRHVIFSNLGDSRMYILNKGIFQQTTKDHSYIQEYQDKNNGFISQEIIQNYSNFITKSLDGGKDVPDIFPVKEDFLKLKKGTLILLCTDGLILYQREESKLLRNIILDLHDIRATSKVLIENAHKRGSSDNITVILYEYGKHKRNSQILRIIHKLRKKKKSTQLNKKNGQKAPNVFTAKRLILTGSIFIMIIAYFLFVHNFSNSDYSINHHQETPTSETISKPVTKSEQVAKWDPLPDKSGLSWGKKIVIDNSPFVIIVNGNEFDNPDITSFVINRKNKFKVGKNNVLIKNKSTGEIKSIDFTLPNQNPK